MAEHQCEKTEETEDEEAQVQEDDAEDKEFAEEIGQELVLGNGAAERERLGLMQGKQTAGDFENSR